MEFATKSPSLSNSRPACMPDTSICFFFSISFALLYIVNFTTPDVFQIEGFCLLNFYCKLILLCDKFLFSEFLCSFSFSFFQEIFFSEFLTSFFSFFLFDCSRCLNFYLFRSTVHRHEKFRKSYTKLYVMGS